MSNRKKIRGILLFGLLIVLSVFWLWCFVGAPSFTPEMAMHRAESCELIGPSNVIAKGKHFPMAGYDSFILGETAYGYTLYEYEEGYLEWDDILTYAEKADGVTLFSLGAALGYYGDLPGEDGYILPVMAIPKSTRAVSAKLTVTAQYNGTTYETSDTAILEQGVYFLFGPDTDNIHAHVRNFWARRLQGDPPIYYGVSGSATLELYDSQGKLVDTIFWDLTETA